MGPVPASCVVQRSSQGVATVPAKKRDHGQHHSHHENRRQECRLDRTEEKELILKGLRQEPEFKELPARFLYDKRGSELYDAITKLEQYYPYKAEDELFDEHVQDIASEIPEGSIVVELGCGSATKTARLLSAIINHHGRCQFVGIDVSESFLDDAKCNLMLLVEGQLSVEMVQADNLEGLRHVRRKYPDAPLCLVWLGSSVGNFDVKEAVSFFRDVLEAVDLRCRIFLCTAGRNVGVVHVGRKLALSLLLSDLSHSGMMEHVSADMWKKATTLYSAYHDREGVTEQFIKNGMRNALRILGYKATPSQQEEELKSWVYEVEINSKLRQVMMYLQFPRGLKLPEHGVVISPGEKVLMEISRKFTVEDIHFMAQESGFHVTSAWRNEKYGSQMLLSQVEALSQCWHEGDTLFQGVPDWTVKPIDVRHPFCFYYGHLGAFMKLKTFPDEPASEFDTTFSRGIDPAVLDPTQCHSHPEIPQEWPSVEEIVTYVKGAREKVLKYVTTGGIKQGQEARLLVLVVEHDYMHHETLSYMIAQERKAAFEKSMAQRGQQQNSNGNNHTDSSSPSPAQVPPTTASIVQDLSKHKMIHIESGSIILGADAAKSAFLWDNEYPQLRSNVSAFLVSPRPVSIGEFYRFVLEGGYDNESLWDPADFKYLKEQGLKFPATWSRVDNEIYVHEFQATNQWSKIAHQPVFVSLSEAEAFCRWVGGGARIMTETEYQRILDVDKHEKVVTQMRYGGWEWTSTPFQPFPGFKPMPEYPEYSSDFFDGNHFVLKGSSPVTHPCLLRDTFRNYYQKQYPYVFAKFRCCKS